jgi:hypothetical protein
MKTCPVCALDLEDSYLFCPDDGSNLGGSFDAPENEQTTVAPNHSQAEAVVLYCPTCAAEYPLTFSECPVHGIKLTKHQLREPSSIPIVAPVSNSSPEPPTSSVVPHQKNPEPIRLLTTLPLQRPEIDVPHKALPKPLEPEPQHEEVKTQTPPTPLPVRTSISEDEGFREYSSLTGDKRPEHGSDRPGFRVAAIAVVVALSVGSLVAIYSLVKNLSRKRATAAVQVSNNVAATPLPFVPTPQQAQDYKEEPPPPAAVSEGTESTKKGARPVDTSRSEAVERSRTVNPPVPQKPQPTAPVQPTPVRVSTRPMPPLPSGNSGGFDARLIRMRSRKTAQGFRYDLTFNMQEKAGRWTQWQRVLVTTHSASGLTHSQAIPFSERLGATGALTFTISVELLGRNEADWQGRVVCTTLGWDNKGAPLQASFGANIAP